MPRFYCCVSGCNGRARTFYNPFAQFVVKATQPVVRPLRRIIPAIGPIDTASVLVAYVAVLLKLLFPWFLAGFQGQLGGLMLLVAFFNLLYLAGMTVFWVILARALLSWFSGAATRWIMY